MVKPTGQSRDWLEQSWAWAPNSWLLGQVPQARPALGQVTESPHEEAWAAREFMDPHDRATQVQVLLDSEVK